MPRVPKISTPTDVPLDVPRIPRHCTMVTAPLTICFILETFVCKEILVRNHLSSGNDHRAGSSPVLAADHASQAYLSWQKMAERTCMQFYLDKPTLCTIRAVAGCGIASSCLEVPNITGLTVVAVESCRSLRLHSL
jgi:hypothetical protein